MFKAELAQTLSFCISARVSRVNFKISGKKTSTDPQKISQEIFPSL
jgi:hypothetical protein